MKTTKCPKCGKEHDTRLIEGKANRIFCGRCRRWYVYVPSIDESHLYRGRDSSHGLAFW